MVIMTRWWDRKLVVPAVVAFLLVCGACQKGKDTGSVAATSASGMPSDPGMAGGPGMGGWPGGPGMAGGPPAGGWPDGPPPGVGPGGRRPIKDLMMKLAGRNSLTPKIGQELKQDSPPWDAIQAQTKEFAELASNLGKHDPPRGSKESWTKLTSSYSESALALDQAAQAKDKAAALAAHGTLAGSCMACHREHRMGGPGRGGPGGGGPPGPFGPPPGGAPSGQ
jgi:hypothetical protein